MTDAYIFDAVRTPRGKGRKDGALHEVTPVRLAVTALQAIRDRNKLDTHLVDDELSIGDYVLAGGEVAAMVVIEAVGRLVPGVLGNEVSVEDESFSTGLLEYPQYTRPADFRGWEVPEVLRSGDHGRVEHWRRAEALRRTLDRRPDLLDRPLTVDEQQLLDDQ